MHVFKAAVVAVAVISLSSCTFWAPKSTPSWNDATGGEQFERLLWDDIRAQNFRSLEKRMALTVTWMTPQGPLDRAGAFDLFGRMKVTNLSFGEVKVTPNRDTMTVAYHLHRAATLDGAPMPSPVHAITVWQQSEHGWLVIAHSEQTASAE